jgi:hypothetical protein
MSVNSPELYRIQFAEMLDLALQQKDSRFEATVTKGSHKGKQASPIEYAGQIAARKRVGRFNPMSRVDLGYVRRWVFPQPYDLPQLFDNIDEIKMMIDPKSKATEAAKAAMNRSKDEAIVESFFADAKVGEKGDTTVSFTAGNVIAVGFGAASATGLNAAKIMRGKKILKANQVNVDEDPIYCAISAQQEEDLLKEAVIISKDYNDTPVLVDGRLRRWLGVNFIDSELLQVDSSSYRRVPMYAKSGMYLGMFDEVKTDVSQRRDIEGLPWQIYNEGVWGATRTDEKRVIEIKCAE